MTEHQILDVYNQLAAMSLATISVGISVFGAYLIMLFVFLRRAPRGMRITAYGAFTAAFVLKLIYFFNLASPMLDSVDALQELSDSGVTLSAIGQGALDRGKMVIVSGVSLMFPLFTAIWLLFGYMSFFFQWPDTRSSLEDALDA